MEALAPVVGLASRALGCRGSWVLLRPIKFSCWTTYVLESSCRLTGRSELVWLFQLITHLFLTMLTYVTRMNWTTMLNQLLKHCSHFFVLVSLMWTTDHYLIWTLQRDWTGLDEEKDLATPIGYFSCVLFSLLVSSKQKEKSCFLHIPKKQYRSTVVMLCRALPLQTYLSSFVSPLRSHSLSSHTPSY